MLYTRKGLLAVKIESTPGTKETLAGTDAAFNAMNTEITPSIPVSERPLQASFRTLPGVPGPQSGTCSFSIELIGQGDGTYPTWATTLLAACGIVEASANVGSPAEEAPGTNVKTVTIGHYTDGVLTELRGCSGNVQFVFQPGMAVMCNFTFTGAWVGESAVAVPSFTAPTRFPIKADAGTCTINSVTQRYATLTLDLGNIVTLRPDITADGGFRYATISGRNPTITLDAEQTLLATEDPIADWEAGTTRAFSLSVSDADDTITFAAPAAQMTNSTPGDREGLRLRNKTLNLRRSGTDPELTITCS